VATSATPPAIGVPFDQYYAYILQAKLVAQGQDVGETLRRVAILK
jgi:hypothetical protein